MARLSFVVVAVVLSACGTANVSPGDSPDAQEALSANLVSNPSFEVDVSGWTARGASVRRVASSSTPAGLYAARLAWSSGTTFSLQHTPAVVASPVGGSHYDASAWVRSSSTGARGKVVRLTLRQGDLELAHASAVLSGDFVQLSLHAVIQTGQVPLNVNISEPNAAAGDSIDVDLVDVHWVKAPTPDAGSGEPVDAGTHSPPDAGSGGAGSPPGPVADGQAFSEPNHRCNYTGAPHASDVLTNVRTVNVDGGVATPVVVQRCYHVHVPADLASHLPANGKVPALVLLHGAGNDGPVVMNATDTNEVADANHFVAIYPDGRDGDTAGTRAWSSGCCSPKAELPEDFDFLEQIATDLARGVTSNGTHYAIDSQRLYLSGHSSGAMMALSQMCAAHNSFGAAAVVAGFMVEAPVLFPNGRYDLNAPVLFPSSTAYDLPADMMGVGVRCAPNRPIPVLMINGTADGFNGHGAKADPAPNAYQASRPEALNWLALMNHCTRQTVTDVSAQYGSAGPDLLYDYSGCSSGIHTQLLALKNASHVFWMQAGPYAGATTGQIVWGFVSQYRGP